MRIITPLLFVLLFLVSCVSISEVVPAGKDTWMLAGTGTGMYSGSFTADLYKKADDFCKSKNKMIMPVSQDYIPTVFSRPATANLFFRCLIEGDPELTRPTMPPFPHENK